MAVPPTKGKLSIDTPYRLAVRLSRPPVDSGAAIARRPAGLVAEAEFRRRADGWRRLLAANARDSVALFEPDGAEFAAALFGIWSAGRTAILPADTLGDTCRMLREQGVTLVGRFPSEFVSLREPPDGDANATFESLDADAVRTVIHTSGSTGAPRAFSKRLRQLAAEVEMLDAQFGDRLVGAEIISTVSHQHIYGLLFKVLWPLATGRVFGAETLEFPEGVARTLAERRAAVVSSPAHLKRWHDGDDWLPARANACAVFSSAGPLPPETGSHVDRLLAQVPIEVYGSSETGGIAWRACPGGEQVPWTPLPHVELSAAETSVRVRSPYTPDGDWFDLADAVTVLADGRFTLRGRTDRIAKVEGKRISLEGVENALAATGLVADSRVVMLTGSRDTLAAALIPSAAGWEALRTEGATAVQNALVQRIGARVERIALPRRWRWVEKLPVDSQGKVTTAGVEQLFDRRGPAAPFAHVKERTETHRVLELLVPRSLRYFDGHFDGMPVLPGVTQIDWAIMYGRREFAIPANFLHMEAIKFHRLYRPDALLTLELTWRADRSELVFKFTSRIGVHSSGRITFGA